jgi:hypothetical protein
MAFARHRRAGLALLQSVAQHQQVKFWRTEFKMKFSAPASIAFLLVAIPIASAAKPRVEVKVIENLPTTLTYDWQVSGHGSVSCYSSGCSSYFTPASAGTSQVSGAVLKLLLADGRIVIAGCSYNKGNFAFGFIGAMTGDANLNSPRNCAVPQVNDVVQAEFSGSIAKLFWRRPSLDGKGAKEEETYVIRGVLQPVAGGAVPIPAATADQWSEIKRLEAEVVTLRTRFTEIEGRMASLKNECATLPTNQHCLGEGKRLLLAGQENEQATISALDQLIPKLNALSSDDSAARQLSQAVDGRRRVADDLGNYPAAVAMVDQGLSDLKKE